MKEKMKIAAVQFEMKQNDKKANLETMAGFIDQAYSKGVDIISFPEICISGYHFLTTLDKKDLLKVAESTDDGHAVKFFHKKAKETGMTVMFGLLERGDGEDMHNTYVVITPEGKLFQHRKVHAFENSAIIPGNDLDIFELYGWKCGILICYDNNLPENNRILTLKGAEIIFAPHQTGGFDIKRAGMGRIPLELWNNRETDPVPIKQSIMGPKGREWILKWLPSRSYDNNVYTVFTNGVGIDGPEVRTGNTMILDPEGIILTETSQADDDMVIATVCKSGRENTLAGSHMAVRRPSLYGKISEPIEEEDTRAIRNKMSGENIK